MIKRCEESGLAILWEANLNHLNKPLVHALVERFMPETNIFYFPNGVTTITLDDVANITKLSVSGELLTGERVTPLEADKLVSELFGMEERDASTSVNEGHVLLTWLRDNYKDSLKEDETDDEEINWHVRAYLLCVLGETIFSDKSGAKVSLTWLKDLSDVAGIHKKAWGLAALVYLYKQLGIASRSHVQQICGYMQLIEFLA
ncbi:protein-serine/threonine phosphatase [Ranunculus cassubicifolius]